MEKVKVSKKSDKDVKQEYQIKILSVDECRM